MMQIPYIEPAQSQTDIDRAVKLVDSMTKMIEILNHYGNQPRNQFTILGRDARATLRGRNFPATLVNNVAFFTEEVRVPQDGGFVVENQLMVGFTSDAFRSDLYASDAIKKALIKSHAGRCAYCETLINHNAYGDVEHFRPKAAYTTPWSPALFRPAYFHLAYNSHNLLYSCQLCNETYKKNTFEVIGPRVPAVSVVAEEPVLINPYTEDPRNFVRFNPVNGYAYPFDLTLAFYSKTQGWGPPQTANEIWCDPSKIPGQKNPYGVVITNAQVESEFQSWLQTVQNPQLKRGTATISTLGLNRLSLVRARIGHLRHLRGLAWTAQQGSGADQSAAQQLMGALKEGKLTTALIAPQYLSLSIDAAQTWNAQGGPGAASWIDDYNRILEAFVQPTVEVEPPPHNDALSYLLFEDDLSKAGQRRLVYISGSDAVYGNPQGRKGIFLGIDWASEIGNTVLVCRDGVVRQQMTLANLLNVLDASRSAYGIFRNNELWVVGDFPPFTPCKP